MDKMFGFIGNVELVYRCCIAANSIKYTFHTAFGGKGRGFNKVGLFIMGISQFVTLSYQVVQICSRCNRFIAQVYHCIDAGKVYIDPIGLMLFFDQV
ncbi:hypothetical protein D3C80_1796110 [compost metagenome]